MAVRAYFTNGGTNYENEVYYWIDGAMEAGAGLYINPGMSGDVILCMPAPSKGSHQVKITTDWDGNDVIYKGKLDITEAPSCQLEGTATVSGLKREDNRLYVHDKLDIVINLKNVGTTTFNNRVSAYISESLGDENGLSFGSDSEGYPRWVWNDVRYLRLEPDESTAVSYSIGKEVFRPNGNLYGINIFFYNNHQQLEIIYNEGLFAYVDDAEGIVNTIMQPSSETFYYDLQGRRIDKSALQPGIYIHNNRKIVIR